MSLPSNNLKTALAYTASGLPIFPVEARGKTPLIRDWQNKATADEKAIRSWWAKWPTANIGLHVGKAGLAVIDVDPRNGGDTALDEMILRHGRQWLSNIQIGTGGGGWHFYYALPDGVEAPASLARC